MDFHEISMKGKFICEILSSNPTWASSDEGRVIYNSTEHIFYYGTNSAWQRINGLVRITVSDSEPSSPVNGQELWINTSTGTSSYYIGSAWVSLGATYK